MKLIKISPNFHKVVYPNGNEFYFSYETLVAAVLPYTSEGQTKLDRIKTSTKYSPTTSKQVGSLEGFSSLDQKNFDNVISRAGSTGVYQ